MSYDKPYEKEPMNKVDKKWILPGSTPYHVKDGDSWEIIAQDNGLDVWDLIYANFKTKDPNEVNWYLKHYVGCKLMTVDRKNWKFSLSADPGLIRIPRNVRIRRSVPMMKQWQSPICWVVCVAMISSYKGRASLGVNEFTGGFEPGNSSIPNPAATMDDFYRRLSNFGFAIENPFPSSSPNSTYIEGLLQKHGPWMLTHLVSDLLPGNFQPDAMHAVVITGIDTKTNQVWYNNPWGTVDEVTTIDRILLAMENLFKRGIYSVAYIP
jgi:hypothetical protein